MMLSRITILLFYMLVGTVFGNDNRTDEGLWEGMVRECNANPTMSCVQKNVYRYFDEAFQAKDVDVGGILRFTKNDLDYEPEIDNESDGDEPRGGDSSPLEEVAEALREKAVRFFYTHDMELALPEFLLQGGVLKMSPRALDSIRLDLDPRQQQLNGIATPRILFKKIQKFFSGKLVMALFAILLVIKLIAMKLMFFLPTILGVAAAKKLLLKVLLFVFPVISHLFKLCPYYKPTKYHHHHHQIAHLHQVGGHPVGPGGPHGPPHGHHIPYLQGAHGVDVDQPPDWNEHHHEEDLGYYSDGPSFTADFVNHRKNLDLGKPPRRDDEQLGYKQNGQGQTALGHRGQETKPATKIKPGPLTPAEIENMVLKAEKEAILKLRLQEEQKRVEAENKRLQDSIKNALKLQEKLKIQSLVAKQTSKIAAAYQPNLIQPQVMQPHIVHAAPSGSYQNHQGYMSQQMMQPTQHTQAIFQPNNNINSLRHEFVHQQNNNNNIIRHDQLSNLNNLRYEQGNVNNIRHETTQAVPVFHTTRPPPTPPPRDAFYSPILDKIDNILAELRFHDEPCRERLICSMYKNPTKFSPHSNLLSAELSRDASELQKPTSSNPSVIRFYKYVQAARDGQDKRDCLRLYPSCSVLTE